MNTILAILPAAISAIFGFGIGFQIFKRIYTNSKSQKLISYLIFVSVGVGFTGVFNEFLVALFLGGVVKTDKVLVFIFSNIAVIPSVLYGIIFLLRKFNRKIELGESSSVSNASSDNLSAVNFSISKANFVVIFVILLSAVLLIPNLDNFTSKERRFDVIECQACRLNPTGASNCSISNALKYFIVSENKVVLYSSKDGQIAVHEAPSNDEKCMFKNAGKFSFACSSNSITDISKSDSSKEFDGVENYKSSFRFHAFIYGDYKLVDEVKTSCKVKN